MSICLHRRMPDRSMCDNCGVDLVREFSEIAQDRLEEIKKLQARVKELEEILTLADGFKDVAPHKSKDEIVSRLLAMESHYLGVIDELQAKLEQVEKVLESRMAEIGGLRGEKEQLKGALRQIRDEERGGWSRIAAEALDESHHRR